MSWPEDVRHAIEDGQVLVGFTGPQVQVAMRRTDTNPNGEPYYRGRTALPSGADAEQWVYADRTIVLVGGKVVSVVPSTLHEMQPYRPTPRP